MYTFTNVHTYPLIGNSNFDCLLRRFIDRMKVTVKRKVPQKCYLVQKVHFNVYSCIIFIEKTIFEGFF